MERLHINGDINEMLLEANSSQTKDSIVNENYDSLNSESNPATQITTTDSKVAVEKENEEEINHGGKDLVAAKNSVYVIRSSTSVEENNSNIQSMIIGEDPSSPKPLKFVIRSRSTDEAVDFETTGNNDEKTMKKERSHEDMTQSIAAQATEIVRSVLQRLENEVETINNGQIDQEKTNDETELSRTTISERTDLQHNKQEKENDVSVACIYGDVKSSEENLQMTDDAVTKENVSRYIESIATDKADGTELITPGTIQGGDNWKIATENTRLKHAREIDRKEDSITLNTENVQENDEKEEEIYTKAENDVKSLEEQLAASETTIQEFPSHGLPINGVTIHKGSEENIDDKIKTTEEEGDIITLVQSEHDEVNEQNREKAQNIAMTVESAEVHCDGNNLVTLQTAQALFNKVTKSEAMDSLPEEDVKMGDSEFKCDENKTGKMEMKVENTKDKSDGQNTLLDIETLEMKTPEQRHENEDHECISTESKSEAIVMANGNLEKKSDDMMSSEAEKIDLTSISEEDQCEKSEFKSDESKVETTKMEFDTQKDNLGEHRLEFEKTEVVSLSGDVLCNVNQLIGQDEVMSTQKEEIDKTKIATESEICTVSAIKHKTEEWKPEEDSENENREPSLTEISSITTKEGKLETMKINIESKEEPSEERNVSIDGIEKPAIVSNETSDDQVIIDLEKQTSMEEALTENDFQESSLPEVASMTTKRETMMSNSESKESVLIDEKPVITADDHITVNLVEPNPKEAILTENDWQETSLQEVASMTTKGETMMINSESTESVVIDDKPVIAPHETSDTDIIVILAESNSKEAILTENDWQETSLQKVASMTAKGHKAEKNMVNFESKESVVIDEKTVIAQHETVDHHIKVNLVEPNHKEETIAENEGQEPSPPEISSMTSKDGKTETMTVNFESKEEQSDKQNVAIDQKPVIVHNETTDGQFKMDLEIRSMKFETNEDTADEERCDFAEATVIESEVKPLLDNIEVAAHTVTGIPESKPQEIGQTDCEEVEEATNEESTKADLTIVSSSDVEIVPSTAIERQEEPSSPRHEYVAENFGHDSQPLHEIQEGNEDNLNEWNKPQEKPIVKVRLAEESLGTPIMSENRYGNDVIELDNQLLEPPGEVASDAFKDESDSDGEIDVSVEELSQENEQLIKGEGSEEESTPDDWMAKDDSDEIVFKGKPSLAVDTSFSQIEESRKNTSQMSQQQEITDNEAVVAETKDVTIRSGIEGMFLSGKEVQAQTKETPRVLPAPEYDLDKEIEEDIQLLIKQNKILINKSSMTVMEEILPSQKIQEEEKAELSILLIDEKSQELEEEKPPSPVEAKKVREEGITEIFETEELRRSGIFDDTLVEEDEEGIQLQSKISQKDVVLANEEYFEAKQKEKHASLRWSLLEKWEEMNKRESLEIKESDSKPAIVSSETIKKDKQGRRSPEFEIRATNTPVVPEGLQIEPTTATATKVNTLVTTTTVVIEDSEVQPRIFQTNEQAVNQEVEYPTESQIQTIPGQLLHSDRETDLAFEDVMQSSQEPIAEDSTQGDSTKSWQVKTYYDVREDTLQATSEEIKPLLQEETKSESPNHAIPLSTILFKMDGTPVIVPPVKQQEPNSENNEKKIDKPMQSPVQTDEIESKPMSTILFRMDGTPFVLPAAHKVKDPLKLKTVNFSTETQVRPLSVSSVESVRGDREGIPPLAGGEESDIDDSTLHIASQPHYAPSRVPSVSPVKEDASPGRHINENTSPVGHAEEDTHLVSALKDESSPPSPAPSHDGDEKAQEIDVPLLDQTKTVEEKGQSCCVIF